MKVVIPGGSGHLGSLLAPALHRGGHEVVVLSRSPQPAAWRCLPWNAQTPGEWVSEIEGADVVINLTGRSVNCRYNSTNRRLILDSRVRSTQLLGEIISRANRP